MSKNTSSQPLATIDLAVTMRGDVTADNLPDYIHAVQAEHARSTKVTYGATVVYMAARDLSENFVAADYAAKVGKSAAYVSTLSGLALAVDRSITPHGSEIMGKRWSALVQNMTKEVRKILRDKESTLKDLDRVLFATADAKKDARKERETEARTKAAADAKATADTSAESLVVNLDTALASVAGSWGKFTPTQFERIDSALDAFKKSRAAYDAEHGSPVPVKVAK